MKKRDKIGLLQGIFSISLLSLSSIAGKFLLEEVTPESLVLLRESLSVITILLLFGLTPEIKKVKKFKKKTIFYLVTASLLTGALCPLFFLKGLSLTTATDTILIESMSGVLTGLFATFFLKEKISKEKIIGTILMFTGVLMISTQNFSSLLNINSGYFFLLGGVFAISVANIIFKKHLIHISTDVVVLARNVIGMSFILSFLPLITKTNFELGSLFDDKKMIFILVAYSIFILMTGQFFWYKSLEKIKAITASSIVFLKPILGVIFAYLILNEEFLNHHLFGGIMIILGLLLSIIHKKKHIKDQYHKNHRWVPHWFHF